MSRRRHPCLECNKPCPDSRTIRCKNCAQRERWKNPADPRRAKLNARNAAMRPGRTPYTNREWLRVRYNVQMMNLRQIADEAQCGLRTIARWMARHGIRTRTSVTGRVIGRAFNPARRKVHGNPRRVCPVCHWKKSYYSRQCRKCSPRQIGAANPNFRGLADIKVLVRQWSDDNWRLAVFIRDGFACRGCGSGRSGVLEAHHIIPLAKIVRDKARDWEGELVTAEGRLSLVAALITDPAITSLENGRTLCQACHVEQHRPGWRGADFPRPRTKHRKAS